MKQSRPQANGVSTPPKVDYTAGGLDAPIPSGPARLVGYRYNCNSSSLCDENQHPPAERPNKVCNNQGFSRGQELSDWLGFQSSRRTNWLTHGLCLIWVLRHTVVF